jgi:hypothetical protein
MQADASSQVAEPLRVLFACSVPKDGLTPNEDRWAQSDDGTVCAISDGASVSFDPAAWSELLVQRFVRDPAIDRAWISTAVSEFAGRYDRDALPWSQQAAFDRGSYATLLGVYPSVDATKAYVVALGDSLAVWLDGHEVLATFPYEEVAQFENSPTLLGTNNGENLVFSDKTLEESVAPYTITEAAHPILMLMTDALGHWFVNNRSNSAAQTLMSLENNQSFEAFVAGERLSGRLKRDDTTLIIMGRRDELSPDR